MKYATVALMAIAAIGVIFSALMMTNNMGALTFGGVQVPANYLLGASAGVLALGLVGRLVACGTMAQEA